MNLQIGGVCLLDYEHLATKTVENILNFMFEIRHSGPGGKFISNLVIPWFERSKFVECIVD